MRAGREFQVRVFPNAAELAIAVAVRIGAIATRRAHEGRHLVLGLAAGASPMGVYRALAQRVVAGEFDLTRCVPIGLDEYYPIASNDPKSCSSQLRRVVSDLGIAQGSLLIPSGERPRSGLPRDCEQFEEWIALTGGVDIQILGLGRSGHVGFNEPGTLSESRTRLVELDEVTRQDAAGAFGGLNYTPREALTMGIATIMDASEIALIALGARKSEIVRRLVEEAPSSAVPASLLQPHGCMTIYLDEDAAQLLNRAPFPCTDVETNMAW